VSDPYEIETMEVGKDITESYCMTEDNDGLALVQRCRNNRDNERYTDRGRERQKKKRSEVNILSNRADTKQTNKDEKTEEN